MKKTLLFALALCFSSMLFAQSDVFIGDWTTYDPKTEDRKSVV